MLTDLMQDRYETALQPGADEEAWLTDIVNIAHSVGCAAVSVNGSMWRQSRGRTIAIHVGGTPDALLMFAAAKPAHLKHVKRFDN
jgi:hypothetical protein